MMYDISATSQFKQSALYKHNKQMSDQIKFDFNNFQFKNNQQLQNRDLMNDHFDNTFANKTSMQTSFVGHAFNPSFQFDTIDFDDKGTFFDINKAQSPKERILAMLENESRSNTATIDSNFQAGVSNSLNIDLLDDPFKVDEQITRSDDIFPNLPFPFSTEDSNIITPSFESRSTSNDSNFEIVDVTTPVVSRSSNFSNADNIPMPKEFDIKHLHPTIPPKTKEPTSKRQIKVKKEKTPVCVETAKPSDADNNKEDLICTNCGTTNTPLWRKDIDRKPLCNACGLFFKLHGVMRPLSLKTDVIKKRKRTAKIKTNRHVTGKINLRDRKKKSNPSKKDNKKSITKRQQLSNSKSSIGSKSTALFKSDKCSSSGCNETADLTTPGSESTSVSSTETIFDNSQSISLSSSSTDLKDSNHGFLPSNWSDFQSSDGDLPNFSVDFEFGVVDDHNSIYPLPVFQYE
ncbi:GATA-type zinc finger domain profile [Nakaseomyces glabratus]|nr:GATA-type zinc finger domain profile [Nakaseomyces glabratus]KAH7584659.1 GATA-type zinc finger domain profile [Nakaseomyces glabratus]